VPATTGRDATDADFASLDERRKLALATFDGCGVCGLPFGDETRWLVGGALHEPQPPTQDSGEAPLHEICFLYAAQVCLYPQDRFHDDERAGRGRCPRCPAGYRKRRS
jgi:hypothetical protein